MSFMVVQTPPYSASKILDGSECLVLVQRADVATVLLLSGPRAGREWKLSATHLVAKTAVKPEPQP
ncbi:MAG TPA: hypothetical protein VFS33_03940 [Gemmatimonadales bacterium]|nr:hypothetical protein [Gemmatimonadales bacterium]